MQLRAGCLEVPFNTMPPEGGLPTLPPYLTYRSGCMHHTCSQKPIPAPSCILHAPSQTTHGSKRTSSSQPACASVSWQLENCSLAPSLGCLISVGVTNPAAAITICDWHYRFISPPKQHTGSVYSGSLDGPDFCSSSAVLAGCGVAGLSRPRSAADVHSRRAASPSLQQL